MEVHYLPDPGRQRAEMEKLQDKVEKKKDSRIEGLRQNATGEPEGNLSVKKLKRCADFMCVLCFNRAGQETLCISLTSATRVTALEKTSNVSNNMEN